MANPSSPRDADNLRLGYIMHKAGSTLTAVLIRALTRAATSGATDAGHLAAATHIEDDPATYADATAAPVMLIAGKRGSHVTLSAAGDVGAAQIDSQGALLAQVAGSTSFVVSTASVGTTETSHTPGTGARRVRLFNASPVNTLYYRHATGVTTANGYPIPPGAQDEIDVAAGVVIYLIASGAATDVRIREERF